MIDHKLAQLKGLAAHQLGNATSADGNYFAKNLLDVSDENLVKLLHKYFLSSFSTPEFYSFTFSNDEVEMNPVYRFCKRIFNEPSQLLEQSQNIAKYLAECSSHPNIKSGDFYVAYFDNISVNQQTVSAIGIFKAENHESFIKLINQEDYFGLLYESGIHIDKLDKGCLIFNRGADKGYELCIVDKSSDAIYWREDFLKVKALADNYYHTQNILTVAKTFVTERLDSEDISRADQIDLLNKSAAYFKTNDRYNQEEFTESVFAGNADLKDAFSNYKNDVLQNEETLFIDNFEISDAAVKKQAKIFKSILKLDKNFHVYIHGSKDFIEKGVDEQGRKFYKLFYTEEN